MTQKKTDELKLNLANIMEMANQIKTLAEYVGEQLEAAHSQPPETMDQ